MDTEITQEVLVQKRKKATVVIIIAIAAMVLAIWLIRIFLGSSVTRAEIPTAKVAIGADEPQ